jgi:hypothetical protein
MSISTFFILLISTVIIGLFIRLFWIQILVIGYTIYIIGMLTFYSFIAAIIWAVFVNNSSEGFGLLWLYIFILFVTIIIVYALIVLDIADMAIDFIRKVLKI